MRDIYYEVAELTFKVTVPNEWDIENTLQAYTDFQTTDKPEDDLLFTATFNSGAFPQSTSKQEEVGTSDNDLGYLVLTKDENHYWAKMSYGSREIVHLWTSNKAFDYVQAQLDTQDSYWGLALTSILRIAFSQAILKKQGISIHASCVWKDEEGYLFLGKSGTGKSTHAKMWLQHLEDVELLNDDNPALRIIDGKVFVYGTPWSGKTPCYKQKKYPAKTLVRLEQAPNNEYKNLTGIEAFTATLPSCSVVQKDEWLQELLYDTLIEITDLITVGYLKCLPDKEAAHICYQNTH